MIFIYCSTIFQKSCWYSIGSSTFVRFQLEQLFVDNYSDWWQFERICTNILTFVVLFENIWLSAKFNLAEDSFLTNIEAMYKVHWCNLPLCLNGTSFSINIKHHTVLLLYPSVFKCCQNFFESYICSQILILKYSAFANLISIWILFLSRQNYLYRYVLDVFFLNVYSMVPVPDIFKDLIVDPRLSPVLSYISLIGATLSRICRKTEKQN